MSELAELREVRQRFEALAVFFENSGIDVLRHSDLMVASRIRRALECA